MPWSGSEPTDMRRWQRAQERRLFWLVVLFLVVVGTGLIGLVYGRQAVILAVMCLAGGAAILLLLWGLLHLMERWAGE